MTDLEITKACAKAMGQSICCEDANYCHTKEAGYYDPLHVDDQALALVKKFKLSVGYSHGWGCVKNDERGMLLSGAYHYDELNRAICECAANLRLNDHVKERKYIKSYESDIW